VERNVSVRTPESIAFYYELAGLGSRFLAVAIDTLVQVVILIAVFLLAAWAMPGIQGLANVAHISAKTLESILVAIAIIFLFIVDVGYFVAFETLWNGQTPGKRSIGIRVVRDGGYPVTFMDSVIRNLIRVIEGFPLLDYVPSMISALISSQNKRLGDLAAGTIVVRDRAFEVTDPKKWAAGDDRAEAPPPPIHGLDRISDDEYALADRYVARSHMLEPHAAQETAARIAATIRPKLGEEAARYTDHELLVVVASGRSR